MKGININGYEVKSKLGAGGMAEVYYAENNLGFPAAVKVLKPELGRVEGLRLRFRQEAQVMAKLAHPNIRRVLDITEHESLPVILMEYLSGQDLGAYLKGNGALPPDMAARLWEQATSALQYAHSEGVIHRDVKPSNFFLTDGGTLKLLDFGIAKAGDQLVQTMTGQQMGTVLYMSPEQIKDPKRVTRATDYYSLGVTFYHLLTGEPPYDVTTESSYAIQTKIIQEELNMSSVPAAWRGGLSACLKKEPQKRVLYERVEDFPTENPPPGHSDETLIEKPEQEIPKVKTPRPKPKTPLETQKSPPKSAPQKPTSSNRTPLWLGIIFAAIVVGGGIWWGQNSDQPTEQEPGKEEMAPITIEEEPSKPPSNLPAPIQELERNMVEIKGGSFMMGCTAEQESDCSKREKPVHWVELSSYRVGKYEVTQGQWEAVMGNNPSYFSGCSSCPVETVSWEDTQEFIRKLNQMTGGSYRLPTEAEWEYAARGGNRSRGYKYSGSNNLGSVGWYTDNSGSETHPVGQKSPNELGLYDMSGNVYEWCSDWYDSDYYSSTPGRNPKGPGTGANRVRRGGSWIYGARYCRASNRYDDSPDYRLNYLGFRLAAAP
ncbi:MAG: SUMF1/EgtB/PvdO family nonheme iron enzyme [Phaeodactylibacter sp.]|uniref:bifunctional serine/threonine-protein kinase/formylglycine-generating enzyme family protein n=1 Tax=Phaeodactylibacter sp. TaxID=1940289 RepID=UPI0032EF8285